VLGDHLRSEVDQDVIGIRGTEFVDELFEHVHRRARRSDLVRYSIEAHAVPFPETPSSQRRCTS
jgi:hypothetical protein